MSLNIFHIVSSKKWSGIEQYVYDLASELKKEGNYVEIVTTKRENILNRFRPLEIPISILPLRRKADIESPIRFARLIKRGHNVVHVHNVKEARMALIARRISENRNTRVILTCHTVEKAKKGFVHRMIYNDLDKMWNVCAEGIQTILRREGYPKPYEALKALTRTNNVVDEKAIHDFIETLNVSEAVKEELRAITPHNYTGF